MPKFYNTNERYGDGGPYTAPSKESLAAEMLPCFKTWALEATVPGEKVVDKD